MCSHDVGGDLCIITDSATMTGMGVVLAVGIYIIRGTNLVEPAPLISSPRIRKIQNISTNAEY